jgi:hypothetical protein
MGDPTLRDLKGLANRACLAITLAAAAGCEKQFDVHRFNVLVYQQSNDTRFVAVVEHVIERHPGGLPVFSPGHIVFLDQPTGVYWGNVSDTSIRHIGSIPIPDAEVNYQVFGEGRLGDSLYISQSECRPNECFMEPRSRISFRITSTTVAVVPSLPEGMRKLELDMCSFFDRGCVMAAYGDDTVRVALDTAFSRRVPLYLLTSAGELTPIRTKP